MNYIPLAPPFCAVNEIMIVDSTDISIIFGLINTDNLVLKNRIRKAYPYHKCIFQVLDQETFNIKLSQMYSVEKNKDTENEKTQVPAAGDFKIDRITDDAPAVNLLNSILLQALSGRASDIHIESGSSGTCIRFRIDGLLEKAGTISAEQASSVSARLKILSNLNVLENRRPQDGHIDIKTEDYSLDARISIIPTIWGESIVLRLLNRSDTPLSLDMLGFSAAHSVYLKNLLALPSGLILVTGPTGSGKTTTLAAILKELKAKNSKIISIEDPVEYRIEGITQIQVNEELDLKFDSLLRRIFRQDPDVIMIGEIRDTETAELAARAALTGHLVFATLHTNDAAEAVYRLQNMGIPAYMTAAVLRMIITQRLVRKICPECNAKGCVGCSGTGYRGRTVIAEIISLDNKLSSMISSCVHIDELRNHLGKNNHLTLFDDAEEKVSLGITTRQETERELGSRQ